MSQIEIFKSALDEEIESYAYGTHPLELYEPIRYLMHLQGKRLRPMLTLLAAGMFTEDWKHALKPAHAVEVFHNFTLMHDDIMDNAPLRRGSPTVHAKWNTNTAILSGDVMLVQAYELFLNSPEGLLPKILKRFNRTAAEVCEGQQLDMNFETRQEVSIPEYIEMIRLKTSVLLGYSLELGAILGGAEDTSIRSLYEAGVNMGLGFQLKDDLLDVYGDPERFGKQVGGDILANKKTYLYLKALDKADEDTRQELLVHFGKPAADARAKVEAVTAIYNRLGIRDITEELIRSYFEKALKAIEGLPVEEDRKVHLLGFAEYLMNRDK